MIYVGCHLSSAKGFEAMGKTAVKLHADTFAFFTRNPRGGNAKAIDPEDVRRFLALAGEQGFGKIVAHAPYTLNPCGAKPEVRDFAFRAFKEDLERMEYIPGNYYNFHPGSHVGQGAEKGIELIAELLNECIRPEQTTTVLLETMAGKGSEVGGRFEELRAILDRVECRDKIGVCLDTCHVWDGGYDIVNDLDGVLRRFDEVVGLDRLKAIHSNDSLNPLGARKDRHAKLGEGHIGLEAFARIASHPFLQGLPFVMETPNDDEGWAKEIAMMREFSLAGGGSAEAVQRNI